MKGPCTGVHLPKEEADTSPLHLVSSQNWHKNSICFNLWLGVINPPQQNHHPGIVESVTLIELNCFQGERLMIEAHSTAAIHPARCRSVNQHVHSSGTLVLCCFSLVSLEG